MSCVKQTKGHYVAKKRRSPPYQAQECSGRNEELWISKADKNLKYTWKPLFKFQ